MWVGGGRADGESGGRVVEGRVDGAVTGRRWSFLFAVCSSRICFSRLSTNHKRLSRPSGVGDAANLAGGGDGGPECTPSIEFHANRGGLSRTMAPRLWPKSFSLRFSGEEEEVDVVAELPTSDAATELPTCADAG